MPQNQEKKWEYLLTVEYLYDVDGKYVTYCILFISGFAYACDYLKDFEIYI